MRRPFAADELDEQLFERPSYAGAGPQLVDPSLRDEAASCNDADVGRETLDDLQDVRRQKDSPSASDERLQQVLDLARRDGIDAFERLIEK